MKIPSYNKKRSKAEFAEWTSQWLTERLNLRRLHELHRRDRESKKMHEEAFVVYRYLKRYHIHDDIFVELREGNQPFDAILTRSDNSIIEYLEVTVVPQESDHDFRHELADKGGYSLQTQLTHNPFLKNYALVVSGQIKKKLQKAYPENTTLLVELASEMVLEDQDRFEYVIGNLDPTLSRGNFRNIILLDEPGTFYHEL